ncbi:MAG: AAA family ATPase, partial [Candidatus Eisenbacteria bacterium]
MDELSLLIQSRHPLVVVECDDEARLLARLADSCGTLGLPLFTWTVTEGIRRMGAASPVYETAEPAKALAHIEAAASPGVYAFCDLSPYLTDARLVRRLREVAQAADAQRATLVLSGPAIELPAELRPLAARWTLELPAREELSSLVLETFKELNQGHSYRYQMSREELDRFVGQLAGLSAPEARRVVARCVLDDGALDIKDLAIAVDAKKDRVANAGVLEFEDAKAGVVELGGLANLKGWLTRAQAGYSERARELGLAPLRGLLLVGVQGCGKSLACRAVARQWGLPLLRLDAGRLFDKYVGESEKNLRKAFETAEAVAPVVLWIDEIEKAFAGG